MPSIVLHMLALGALVTAAAAGQEAAGGPSGRSEVFEQAIVENRALLQTFVELNKIPGLAVAVAVSGEIVWSEGFGLADLESRVPVTPRSRFRIASISKNLTATAAAKLAQDGRLDLDAPISRYLDSIPDAWRLITTHQLLSHASGIGHYASPEDALGAPHYNSTQESLGRFMDRPLVHRPGEAETYSSYAYTVVAAIIEAVSGKTFLSYMRDELFMPLGMSNTVPDLKTTLVPGRTGFYQYSETGEIENAPYIDLSGRWAGSGFLSTAEDLVRFGDAHTRAGFLHTTTLERIRTPLRLANGELTREGLAWGPRKDWDGRDTLWGNGSTPGASCGLMVFPDSALTIALLSNVRGGPINNGEFYLLALRFLAAIEGTVTTQPRGERLGKYELTFEQGENKYSATLDLTKTDTSYSGVLDLAGQQFGVLDAFIIGSSTWVVTHDPVRGFLLPLRLHFAESGITGDFLRTGFSVVGKKIKS